MPWLPGKAFAAKGLCSGILTALALAGWRAFGWDPQPDALEIAAWLLMVPAVAAYLGMNFTGASTYTSLSGVKKEMRVAVPLQIAAVVLGAALWIGSRFGV